MRRPFKVSHSLLMSRVMPTSKALDRMRIFPLVLGLTLCWTLMTPATSAAVDVYILYDGKSKQTKTTFLEWLHDAISVKSYNVDLLAVADYSGKQKVLTKFNRAKVIVILLDGPMKILEGALLKKGLVIVQSVLGTVKSKKWTLYVLRKGDDLSKIGKGRKTLEATTVEQLQKVEELKPLGVILGGGALDPVQAGSIVTETLATQ